jgi:dTDP-4-amino-4,6-dideoxygalactose transaminase
LGPDVAVAFLDLKRHVAGLRKDLEGAFAAALDSGRFVLEEAVAEFEREWASFCGASYAVGVGSGTDALTVALGALDVGPGDEVLTAANTCPPTVAAIEATGARPRLVDVDEETLTMDPAAAEAAIGPRVRAVVPVHLYGQCADMQAIAAVARDHGLKVVEDAAQAHGARREARRPGALADAAAYSFYPTKNLGCLGDGGAIVTNDVAVAERARLIRNLGASPDGAIIRGRNSRLDAIQARILLAKLPHLDTWVRRRRALAARYKEALAESPLTLPARRFSRPAWGRSFTIRWRSTRTRRTGISIRETAPFA